MINDFEDDGNAAGGGGGGGGGDTEMTGQRANRTYRRSD